MNKTWDYDKKQYRVFYVINYSRVFICQYILLKNKIII